MKVGMVFRVIFVVLLLSILANTGLAIAASLSASPRSTTPGTPVSFTYSNPDTSECLVWDFADGSGISTETISSATVHKSHTFSEPGSYTVKVWDQACDYGGAATASVTVTIRESGPSRGKPARAKIKKGTIQVIPSSPQEGANVTLTARGLKSSCVRWVINGSPIKPRSISISHQFKKSGRNTIEIYGDCGKLLSGSKTITVLKVDRRLRASKTTVKVGEPVSFTTSGFLSSCVKWELDKKLKKIAKGRMSHTYKRPGKYTVKAIDQCGAKGIKPETVLITVLGEALSITKVDLLFDNNKQTAHVKTGDPLAAQAILYHKGKGNIQYQWLVNNQVFGGIQSLRLHRTKKKKTTVKMPKRLPTEKIGSHKLSLRLIRLNPDRRIPEISYTVDKPIQSLAQVPMPSGAIADFKIEPDIVCTHRKEVAVFSYKVLKIDPTAKLWEVDYNRGSKVLLDLTFKKTDRYKLNYANDSGSYTVPDHDGPNGPQLKDYRLDYSYEVGGKKIKAHWFDQVDYRRKKVPPEAFIKEITVGPEVKYGRNFPYNPKKGGSITFQVTFERRKVGPCDKDQYFELEPHTVLPPKWQINGVKKLKIKHGELLKQTYIVKVPPGQLPNPSSYYIVGFAVQKDGYVNQVPIDLEIADENKVVIKEFEADKMAVFEGGQVRLAYSLQNADWAMILQADLHTGFQQKAKTNLALSKDSQQGVVTVTPTQSTKFILQAGQYDSNGKSVTESIQVKELSVSVSKAGEYSGPPTNVKLIGTKHKTLTRTADFTSLGSNAANAELVNVVTGKKKILPISKGNSLNSTDREILPFQANIYELRVANPHGVVTKRSTFNFGPESHGSLKYASDLQPKIHLFKPDSPFKGWDFTLPIHTIIENGKTATVYDTKGGSKYDLKLKDGKYDGVFNALPKQDTTYRLEVKNDHGTAVQTTRLILPENLPEITHLYFQPSTITEGEPTKLCYGFKNALDVKFIQKHSKLKLPFINGSEGIGCNPVTPNFSTSITLAVSNSNDTVKKDAFIKVNQRPGLYKNKPLINFFRSDKKKVIDGESCTLSYEFTGGDYGEIKSEIIGQGVVTEAVLSMAEPGKYKKGTLVVTPKLNKNFTQFYYLVVDNAKGRAFDRVNVGVVAPSDDKKFPQMPVAKQQPNQTDTKDGTGITKQLGLSIGSQSDSSSGKKEKTTLPQLPASSQIAGDIGLLKPDNKNLQSSLDSQLAADAQKLNMSELGSLPQKEPDGSLTYFKKDGTPDFTNHPDGSTTYYTKDGKKAAYTVDKKGNKKYKEHREVKGIISVVTLPDGSKIKCNHTTYERDGSIICWVDNKKRVIIGPDGSATNYKDGKKQDTTHKDKSRTHYKNGRKDYTESHDKKTRIYYKNGKKWYRVNSDGSTTFFDRDGNEWYTTNDRGSKPPGKHSQGSSSSASSSYREEGLFNQGLQTPPTPGRTPTAVKDDTLERNMTLGLVNKTAGDFEIKSQKTTSPSKLITETKDDYSGLPCPKPNPFAGSYAKNMKAYNQCLKQQAARKAAAKRKEENRPTNDRPPSKDEHYYNAKNEKIYTKHPDGSITYYNRDGSKWYTEHPDGSVTDHSQQKKKDKSGSSPISTKKQPVGVEEVVSGELQKKPGNYLADQPSEKSAAGSGKIVQKKDGSSTLITAEIDRDSLAEQVEDSLPHDETIKKPQLGVAGQPIGQHAKQEKSSLPFIGKLDDEKKVSKNLAQNPPLIKYFDITSGGTKPGQPVTISFTLRTVRLVKNIKLEVTGPSDFKGTGWRTVFSKKLGVSKSLPFTISGNHFSVPGEYVFSLQVFYVDDSSGAPKDDVEEGKRSRVIMSSPPKITKVYAVPTKILEWGSSEIFVEAENVDRHVTLVNADTKQGVRNSVLSIREQRVSPRGSGFGGSSSGGVKTGKTMGHGSFKVSPNKTTRYYVVAHPPGYGLTGKKVTSIQSSIVTVEVSPRKIDIREFSAKPNPVERGKSSTLTYRIANATSAEIFNCDTKTDRKNIPLSLTKERVSPRGGGLGGSSSGGVKTGNKIADGTLNVTPTVATRYCLKAMRPNAQYRQKSVEVKIKGDAEPKIHNFSANAKTIPYNGSVLIRYDFENAYKTILQCGGKQVSIPLKYKPSLRMKGSQAFHKITRPHHCLLRVYGSGSQMKFDSLELKVEGVPTREVFYFTGSKSWFNDNVTLKFKVSGARTIQITRGTKPIYQIKPKNGELVEKEYVDKRNYRGFPVRYSLRVWYDSGSETRWVTVRK